MLKRYCNREFSCHENMTNASLKSYLQCCNLILMLQQQTVFVLSQTVESRFFSLLQVLQFPLQPKPLKAIRSELTRLTFFHRSCARLTHDSAPLFPAGLFCLTSERCDAIVRIVVTLHGRNELKLGTFWRHPETMSGFSSFGSPRRRWRVAWKTGFAMWQYFHRSSAAISLADWRQTKVSRVTSGRSETVRPRRSWLACSSPVVTHGRNEF